MERSAHRARARLGAAALALSGILFVLYPAIRPFSVETSLQGAAAFASTAWLLAHMLAMVAFTLLAVGLLGLHSSLQESPVERLTFRAVVLSVIGIGLTLPFYGARPLASTRSDRRRSGSKVSGWSAWPVLSVLGPDSSCSWSDLF